MMVGICLCVALMQHHEKKHKIHTQVVGIRYKIYLFLSNFTSLHTNYHKLKLLAYHLNKIQFHNPHLTENAHPTLMC